MAPNVQEKIHNLTEAIDSLGIVEVVKQSSDAQSVKLLCRVHDKKVWCQVLEVVLIAKSGWDAHVCQQYFLKDGKLVYGWNFIIQSPKLVDALTNATSLISRTRSAITKAEESHSGEITSMPLIGASPIRNNPIVFDPRLPGPSKGGPSHKGAFTIAGD